MDLFKLRYDYHNAKVILKAEAMGQDPKRLLSDSGRIPGAKLLEIYNEDKRAQLPETLATAMAEARSFKDAVGFCPSSLTHSFLMPSSSASSFTADSTAKMPWVAP